MFCSHFYEIRSTVIDSVNTVSFLRQQKNSDQVSVSKITDFKKSKKKPRNYVFHWFGIENVQL